MNHLSVVQFIEELEQSLKENFPFFEMRLLFHTENSFKANILLEKDSFISVRFNSRNGRMDFALIIKNQRKFGYDNLKKWHYHPVSNPDDHIFCEAPSIKKMINDIKEAYQGLKEE